MPKDPRSKIKPLHELSLILAAARRKGKLVVHCHGVFDLLHPGHIRHFEAARKKGDVLVVTLTRDEHVNKGPGRPVFSQLLRAESIAALECVDYVAINEWPTAVETIRKLRPDFYVKGSDYAQKSNDLTGKIAEEEEAVKSVGGTVHFTDELAFSSSTLINTFFTPYPDEAKDFFQKFRTRYSAEHIIKILKSAANLRVLVIGDIIIDEYHYCTGIGKAIKDNIIVTRYLNEEVFAGGALAAANHIAGFCGNVTLVSAIGTKNAPSTRPAGFGPQALAQDSARGEKRGSRGFQSTGLHYADFIGTRLKTNITTQFYYDQTRPTVVKRRFVDPAFLNKLFEICYLDGEYIRGALEEKVCAYLNANLKNFDMVLAADFGHGFITPKIVDVLCGKAKFLAMNVQTNSANMGFNLVTKFPRADYVCIDEPEVRLACHDKFSGIEELILQISKKLSCDKVIITRGHRGASAYSRKDGFFSIPVFSKEVVDRIGAGDAFFSITSPCVRRNASMEAVGFIGNAAGAIKVLIVGNRCPVEPVPLYKYISTLLK